MALDIQSITAKREEAQRLVEKLALLEKLMADPELKSVFVNGNGAEPNGVTPLGVASSDTIKGIETSLVHDESLDPDEHIDDREPLSQMSLIRMAITNLSGRSFTVSDVGLVLRAQGVDINNIQVGRALFRLNRREKLKVVRKGVGKSPNKYQVTEMFDVT